MLMNTKEVTLNNSIVNKTNEQRTAENYFTLNRYEHRPVINVKSSKLNLIDIYLVFSASKYAAGRTETTSPS
jgi:hypothetical protein